MFSEGASEKIVNICVYWVDETCLRPTTKGLELKAEKRLCPVTQPVSLGGQQSGGISKLSQGWSVRNCDCSWALIVLSMAPAVPIAITIFINSLVEK